MSNKNTKLTLLEAYSAMYKFLENEYEMTGSNDIGGMLGGMSMLDDGGTADPAAWEEWLKSVEKIQRGNDSINLKR